MRSVSVRACGAALLLLLVFSSTVPAFADEPPDTVVLQGRIHIVPGLTEEQEGRIHMPPGLAAQQEDNLALWDSFLIWLAHRIPL